MKLNLLIATIAIAAAAPAFSAGYAISNGSGPDANGIENSLGQIYRSGAAAGTSLGGSNGGTSAGAGVVGVGFFSTDSLAGLSSSQLIADFTEYGATGAFSQGGGAGPRGTFSLNTAPINVTGTDFDGKNIYLLVGNGATFATSTEFLVLKSTQQFLGTDDGKATPPTITFDGSSTLLYGTVVADIRTTNTSDGSVTPGWATVAVPEPSAALLGMLGALGLLRRRR